MSDEHAALVPVHQRPFNAETPIRLLDRALTAPESYFVRSHFDVPVIDVEKFTLTLDGLVERSICLSLPEIKAMPNESITVTMECAGNGRTSLNPRPAGVAWGYGAASTARYTGVRLKHVLDLAGPGRALEVVFTAADSGDVEGQHVVYARSLPLAIARLPDTLIAWSMNDEPLTAVHGAPLRLVVPGWYGMASVKWLTRITLSAQQFTGHYQHSDYVYLRQDGIPDGTPVTLMRVRSIIASPADGALLPLAPVVLSGSAWSGEAAITRVEISDDDGRSWHQATLDRPTSERAATLWRWTWTPRASGSFTLIARATDGAGRTQPLEPVWNLRGYGNNSVHRVRVNVE